MLRLSDSILELFLHSRRMAESGGILASGLWNLELIPRSAGQDSWYKCDEICLFFFSPLPPDSDSIFRIAGATLSLSLDPLSLPSGQYLPYTGVSETAGSRY